MEDFLTPENLEQLRSQGLLETMFTRVWKATWETTTGENHSCEFIFTPNEHAHVFADKESEVDKCFICPSMVQFIYLLEAEKTNKVVRIDLLKNLEGKWQSLNPIGYSIVLGIKDPSTKEELVTEVVIVVGGQLYNIAPTKGAELV